MTAVAHAEARLGLRKIVAEAEHEGLRFGYIQVVRADLNPLYVPAELERMVVGLDRAEVPRTAVHWHTEALD